MRKINKHKIALKRKEILEKAEKLKEKGIKYKEMEEILNVNERTLRRWKKAEKELGLRGLEPQSTRPNRLVTKRILTDKMLRIIEQARKENLFYGKEKLKEVLLRKGYDLKLSTIGNGLSILMKQGRILPVYILSCTKERKRIRKFNKCYAQRLPFGHQTQIQIDHMVLNIKGKEIRQFSAYSKKDKLLVTQVYEDATSKTAAKFLTDEVLKDFPFDVKEVQVDGGSEFMGNFEQVCKDNNIKLLVVPPRKPKINGNVERNNRTVQEEYYLPNYNNLKANISSLKIFAKQIQNHYNFVRLHRNLKFNNRLFSPMEFFYLSKTDKCL